MKDWEIGKLVRIKRIFSRRRNGEKEEIWKSEFFKAGGMLKRMSVKKD